ncbi:MAG: NADH-quinone oxidoreductase subunit M [Anaerolineales bacterium]|nr:NADH-quinone oxidoreductase subunit M [Anaerolineales bacterium]
MFSTLTLVTVFPLVGVVILLFLRPDQQPALRWTALATSLITFGLSLIMLGQFAAGDPGFQLVVRAPWFTVGNFAADFHLGVDGISVLLVLLTTFLVPIAIASTWEAVQERVKEFLICFLLLETGMVGVFLALDLLLFYVFWEFTLLPMLFLIGIWGGERRTYAAVKFFLYTFAGSIFMLVAIVWIGLTYGTFAVPDLLKAGLPAAVQTWLFLAFAIAFAIKVPVWPLHSWLPDAHVEAPTAGSVILAGVLLKLGTYGFLRFNLGLFPQAAVQFAPLFGVLAVIGILYGALVSYAQADAKKLVAYSSVSHLGFVMLGLFALNPLGLQGALLQMINHGLSTGALFLLVGFIYERRHTRLLAEFGGLWKVMPLYAALALVVFLSSAGLPGLNGFVGEFTILLGAWRGYAHWGFAAASALGVILAAVYLLWLFQKLFQGEVTNAKNAKLPDLSRREIALLVPILVLIVWIGVYPQPFFNLMAPAVDALAANLNAAALALR